MKHALLALPLLLGALVSGCGGEARCVACGANLTNEQCNSRALAGGCSSGVAQTMVCGSGTAQGCVFHNCLRGYVTCFDPPADAGGD